MIFFQESGPHRYYLVPSLGCNLVDRSSESAVTVCGAQIHLHHFELHASESESIITPLLYVLVVQGGWRVLI